MATRKHVRVVAPDEKPQPTKPMTLVEAVETGDYRAILVAQRREIAEAIPEEKGPAKAALHRQLSLIAKELRALDVQAQEEAAENGGPVPDAAWEAI